MIADGRRDNTLGEFLRARREQVRPADAGIADHGRRRVPGLRREELAFLAGVSIEYYVRLEQGRDRHPSGDVLDALGRVLRLDDRALAHLHHLARPQRRRPRARRPERVGGGVVRLLGRWAGTPALVLGRCTDVLAANTLATALHPGFAPGRNLMRVVFLDPASRDSFVEWDRVARDAVASLRASAGADLDDPQLTDLVGELSLKSDDFRRLWARHDVRDRAAGIKRFNHPLVGELSLDCESFSIGSSPGQTLVVHHAEPGSRDEDALALLATVTGSGGGPSVGSQRQPRPADAQNGTRLPSP